MSADVSALSALQLSASHQHAKHANVLVYQYISTYITLCRRNKQPSETGDSHWDAICIQIAPILPNSLYNAIALNWTSGRGLRLFNNVYISNR